MRRLLATTAGLALIGAACSGASALSTNSVVDVYEVTFQGSATAAGQLVLSSPNKITLPVPVGTQATDLALQLRDQLAKRNAAVLCSIDRGEQGFAILVEGRVDVNTKTTNLGGMGGSSAHVIQRREVVESTVREFLRNTRENNANAVKQLTTDTFYPVAANDLGKGLNTVTMGHATVDCRTASVVAEIVGPGGQHLQNEYQLATTNGLTWRVTGVNTLATWQTKP